MRRQRNAVFARDGVRPKPDRAAEEGGAAPFTRHHYLYAFIIIAFIIIAFIIIAFNIIAFIIIAFIAYPPLGHALHLSPIAFGSWAGTAVNATSVVVGSRAWRNRRRPTANVLKVRVDRPLISDFGLSEKWAFLRLGHTLPVNTGRGNRARRNIMR